MRSVARKYHLKQGFIKSAQIRSFSGQNTQKYRLKNTLYFSVLNGQHFSEKASLMVNLKSS